MEVTEAQAIIEALLIASPDPVRVERIKELLPELSRRTILLLIEQIAAKYRAPGAVLTVKELAGGYQIVLQSRFQSWIDQHFGRRGRGVLSSSALEVLAIVAYLQPVTKLVIDDKRGTDSSYAVKTLLRRQLIVTAGRKPDVPGRPLLYKTTSKFLDQIGLMAIGDLPYVNELDRVNGGQAQQELEES